MQALSIRQPYVEEIMRALKRIEFRTRPTTRIGERFYIYAAKGVPPPDQLRQFSKLCPTLVALKAASLPVGLIVGTAKIVKVTNPTKRMPYFHWHLEGVRRLRRPLKPKRQPQPVWFTPF